MRGGEIKDNSATNQGGGVRVPSNNNTYFRMVAGTIYGNEAGPGIANTANAATNPGAALFKGNNGTATYGPDDGTGTNFGTGDLSINTTIIVRSGEREQ
jgi:hypothetical protein